MAIRDAARTDACELCGAWLADVDEGKHAGHVDHIVPEQFCFEYEVGDPHCRANLICLCEKCHGKKTAIEWRLHRADLVGYLGELRRLGWDMERVKRVLVLYDLLPSRLI